MLGYSKKRFLKELDCAGVKSLITNIFRKRFLYYEKRFS